MNYSSIYQQMIKAYSLIPRIFLNGYALAPIQVYVEVTYKCNLACEFCQFMGMGPSNGDELTSDEIKAVLGKVIKGALVSFTGGEPFVKPGFMALLAETSREKRTHIFTNGTLITDEVAEHLVSLGPRHVFDKGLVLISISLEGLQQAHNLMVKRDGAFQRTVAAVESLIRYRRKKNKKYPLIEIKPVITESNINAIHPLYLLTKKLGADIFNPMTLNTLPHASRTGGNFQSQYDPPPRVGRLNTESLRQQLERITKEATGPQIRTTPQGLSFNEIISYYDNRFSLEKYTCYLPWHGVVITAHGDVIVCPYVKLGNLRQDNLNNLYNNTHARKFREELKKRQVFPGCLGCCALIKR